jgi:hypothetical protein
MKTKTIGRNSKPALATAASRPAIIRASPGAGAARLVARSVEQAALKSAHEHARQAGEERDLLLTANQPILDMVAKDRKAVAATKKIWDLRDVIDKPRRGRVMTVGGDFSSFSFGLTPGVHVFSPPYDLSQPGPTHGATTNATANRNTGEVLADVGYDLNAHGLRAASASIAIGFETTQSGSVSVRPVVQYDISWMVDGFRLSAHSEGKLFVVATREDTGQVVAARDLPLWSRTTQSDTHCGDEIDTALASSLEVTFIATPGKKVIVSIGAAVSGDQSGMGGLGPFFVAWSRFRGKILAKTIFLVAELRP